MGTFLFHSSHTSRTISRRRNKPPVSRSAFAFQAGLVGLSRPAWSLTASLLPAPLIGVFLGRLAVARISERAFRGLIVAVLIATSLSLFAKSFGGLFANA